MNKSALVFLFALSAPAISVAQPVSVGVLGGVPFIEQTNTYGNPLYHDESRPYIIGPSVEVRLPAGFAVEADALYQRIGSTISYQLLSTIPVGTGVIPVSPVTTAFANRTRANTWEFPVLGKYYFRRDAAWQPFVGTGWALRTSGFHQTGTDTILSGSGVSTTAPFTDNFRSDLQVGATFAAGLRYRWGHFAFQPQVRYTRWAGSNFNGQPRRDEAAFYLGISF